jgi:HEAT repeat protein
VRADAIVALGKLGCKATIPMLAALLEDREKVIARAAALALGAFPGDADVVKALRDVGLASEDAFVRGFASVSLGRLGDGAVLPALGARIKQDEPAVRGFALLGLGLFRTSLGAPLLREPLSEDPRTGRWDAAALAVGLTGSRTYSDLLTPALDDSRTTRTPACGALGLALLGEKPRLSDVRSRAWLNSAYWRPGFAQALALLDPTDQSAWLLTQLQEAKRSTERQTLVRALGFAGGPVEARALVDLWKRTPAGDSMLRTEIVRSLAPMVTDREISFARRLLLHTYYLQQNIVLAHLDAFP